LVPERFVIVPVVEFNVVMVPTPVLLIVVLLTFVIVEMPV
jgi:hypothetical protein